MDELILAAWRGALWARVKKMPDLQDALTTRRRRKSKPKTLDEDVRRWQIFFAAAGKERAN
jgi:hypothetical protein